MNSPRSSILRRDAIILVIYFVLALIFTYPLILHFDSFGPGHGVDDPAQTWSIWWLRFAIFDLGANPLTTDYLFYPLGLNLAAYTPTFLNGVLSIPLQFAFSVVAAQNIIVLFALIAGGYGAYLFAREILSHRPQASDLHLTIASIIAGAVYALGAWHINYVVAGHFMLLSNHWLPYFALCLVRWHKSPMRYGACAGLFFVLATWTELTFAPFLAILAALYFIAQLVFQRREWWRQMQALFAFGIIGVIGISPLALHLLADFQRYGYYLTSGVGRIQTFSAEPISFFLLSSQHPFLGAWAQSITNANTSYAFIGYAVLILVALGIWSQHKIFAARFWSIAAILFALLMFGPTLIVNEQATGIPMPFAILRAIPFVNANRYPVRFNVMLMLALTPLIAFGVLHLLQIRRGKIFLSALALLLAFEQLVLPIPLSDMHVPKIFQAIRDEPGDFSILEIPLGWRGSIAMQGKLDDHAQFFQTVHEKRLLGGITSRIPPFKFQYFLEAPIINSLIALEEGREIDEQRRALDQLAAPAVQFFFDIRYVDVNRALTDDAVMRYLAEIFSLQEIYRDETHTVYRVQRGAAPREINLADETARLYFDERWGRVQFSNVGEAYRWAAQNESGIWLPLESRAQTITFRLRAARANQAVQVRVNGQTVATLTLSETWDDYAVALPASSARAGLNEIIFATDAPPVNATRVDDYTIGDTGIISPVDISATGAGFDAGRFGEIWVAGRNQIESKRGYHLVAINPTTGAVDRIGSFDTFGDANESTRLAQFIADAPNGEIIAGVAIDEVSKNLQAVAIAALRSIGVEGDLRFQFRAGQAFIGVKGAQAGQAIERSEGRFPANVSVGKNVASARAAFALMRIEIR